MNAKLILTVAILGFASWWAWKKYVLLQNVQIEFISASLHGGLFNPNIKVNFIVKNPTALSARVTEIDGFITDSKKNKIARLSVDGIYEIDPGSYKVIPLNIQTSTFKLLNTISDFYYNKMQNFDISGFATVDGIPVPYQFNVNI